MPNKITKSEFVKRALYVYGNKYDYSKVEYVNYDTKVCIICPEHGEFWQTPGNHLTGKGCPKCRTEVLQKFNTEKNKKARDEFTKKATEIHGNKYDYSKAEYINSHTKVCIICPEHGEFWQTPTNHLSGNGCPKCIKLFNDINNFIFEAEKVHNNRYDYSKSEYKSTRSKICIICPEHGEFWQTPLNHLKGNGCPKCKTSIMENKVIRELNNKKIKFTRKFPRKPTAFRRGMNWETIF